MLNKVKSRKTGRKIISFMHISLDGFVAGPNEELNRIKVDEEILIMSVSNKDSMLFMPRLFSSLREQENELTSNTNFSQESSG